MERKGIPTGDGIFSIAQKQDNRNGNINIARNNQELAKTVACIG